MRVRLLALILALVTLVGGCQRLKYEKSYKLDPFQLQTIEFDPPAYSQKVTVTVTPINTGVSGYLCKQADYPRVEAALNADKQPDPSLLLGSRVSTAGPAAYTFEATVPPKTAYVVVLKNTTKTNDVKVSVVGK